MMGKLDRMNIESVEAYTGDYMTHLCGLLKGVDTAAVEAVSQIFLDARRKGNSIYFAGNGGSAATASHFAQDLCEVGRKAKCATFKGIGLTDNTSFITAVGNDYGFEKIFTVQMQEVFQRDDVLVVISASGNSRNLVEAVKLANARGGVTIGLLGFDGGELLKLCRHSIHARTEKGEYGPVEDVHMVLDHLITSYLYRKLGAESSEWKPGADETALAERKAVG